MKNNKFCVNDLTEDEIKFLNLAGFEATPEQIVEALKSWIDKMDSEDIEKVYKENFDGDFKYNQHRNTFMMSALFAVKLGLLDRPNDTITK